MKARLFVSLLVISSATLLLLPAAPAGATFPGANGRIAYYDFAERPSQIYTVDADGTDVLQLTTGARPKIDPAWSADGSMIALGSNSRRGASQGRLEIMNADGSARSVVVAYDSDRRVSAPAWSPDGLRIAFCLGTPRGLRILVVDVDGTNLTRLSPPGEDDCRPDWSPDGAKIVFTSFSAGGLWVMDADGTDRVRLTTGFTDDPSWSPDGAMVAFAREPRGSNRFDVFVVNADGSGRTRLTFTDRRWEFTPAWSPDGSSIAFCRGTGPNSIAPCQIWIMNPDGSNATKITSTAAIDEFQLSWQAT